MLACHARGLRVQASFFQWKYKIGQKVNMTSLRIGKRLNWQALWSGRNSAENTYFEMQLKHYSKVLFSYFGLTTAILINKKNSKKIQTYAKLIEPGFSVKTGFSSKSIQTRKLRKSAVNISAAMLKHDYNMVVSTKKAQSPVLYVLGQNVAEYIAKQLSLAPKLKNMHFRRNLTQGIEALTRQVLVEHKNAGLLGIKVLCAGKWRKTGSGRKERLNIKKGELLTQSMRGLGYYGFATTATKYGACGIKVWITYKKE